MQSSWPVLSLDSLQLEQEIKTAAAAQTGHQSFNETCAGAVTPIVLLVISARATVRTLLIRALLVWALLIRSAWLLLLTIVAHVRLLLVIVRTLWRITAILLVLRGILLVVRGLGGRWPLRSVVGGRCVVVDLVGHGDGSF